MGDTFYVSKKKLQQIENIRIYSIHLINYELRRKIYKINKYTVKDYFPNMMPTVSYIEIK